MARNGENFFMHLLFLCDENIQNFSSSFLFGGIGH
jgi:hypothetical protein